jgi:hypothetical protein
MTIVFIDGIGAATFPLMNAVVSELLPLLYLFIYLVLYLI